MIHIADRREKTYSVSGSTNYQPFAAKHVKQEMVGLYPGGGVLPQSRGPLRYATQAAPLKFTEVDRSEYGRSVSSMPQTQEPLELEEELDTNAQLARLGVPVATMTEMTTKEKQATLSRGKLTRGKKMRLNLLLNTRITPREMELEKSAPTDEVRRGVQRAILERVSENKINLALVNTDDMQVLYRALELIQSPGTNMPNRVDNPQKYPPPAPVGGVRPYVPPLRANEIAPFRQHFIEVSRPTGLRILGEKSDSQILASKDPTAQQATDRIGISLTTAASPGVQVSAPTSPYRQQYQPIDQGRILNLPSPGTRAANLRSVLVPPPP